MINLRLKTFCRLNYNNLRFSQIGYNNVGFRYSSSLHNKTDERILQRNEKFGYLNREDLYNFITILDYSNNPTSILSSENDIKSYRTDWLKRFISKDVVDTKNNDDAQADDKDKLAKKIVLRPKSILQISQILNYCDSRNLAIVPQGGNTGLVGGSIPVFDEIVLSLERMNSIIDFDSNSGILTCEAGCILENLDNYLSEKGFMMPLDLGAKGSCQIGGNVATNAGGLRLLRYGSLHGNVLSLQVVLPSGEIVELGKSLRKDNTGYDLKQLFIGSEGTLGVITKISILVPPKPKSINVALLKLKDFNEVLKLYKHAKQDLGEILSAFEFFDSSCLTLVKKHLPHIYDPLSSSEEETNVGQQSFYVLIETSGSNKSHDDEKLNDFLERIMTTGGGKNNTEPLVLDGTISQDENQFKNIWSIRESITESLSKEGGNYKYDVSVSTNEIYNIVEEMKSYLQNEDLYDIKFDLNNYNKDYNKQVTHVVGFGHMGDGNLHLNITSKGYNEELKNKIEDKLYEIIKNKDGSISAEHGIGLMKSSHISIGKSKLVVNLMKNIKYLLDPKGILNPYKMFPN